VVILDRNLSLRWRHVARRIGDHPPLGEVIQALAALHA
jgi:hypothetical protein